MTYPDLLDAIMYKVERLAKMQQLTETEVLQRAVNYYYDDHYHLPEPTPEEEAKAWDMEWNEQ